MQRMLHHRGKVPGLPRPVAPDLRIARAAPGACGGQRQLIHHPVAHFGVVAVPGVAVFGKIVCINRAGRGLQAERAAVFGQFAANGPHRGVLQAQCHLVRCAKQGKGAVGVELAREHRTHGVHIARTGHGAPPAPQQYHNQQRGTQQRAAARGRLHADVRMQHHCQRQAERKYPSRQHKRPPPGAAFLGKIKPRSLTSRLRKHTLHASPPPFPTVFSLSA